MDRVIVHWTAGGNRASASDRRHYHKLVEYDSTIVDGTEDIEDNIVTSDGDYAAHTLRLNTGSIGVAMCGMRGAQESPFEPGPSPLTEQQFRACAALVADLCREYSIPVTPRTVLTHAEVEPTLGVKQRGKWDITRLPWDDTIRGAIPVGDHFRALVRDLMGTSSTPPDRPTLRLGARGMFVKDLQTQLAALRYHAGATDGVFGKLTRQSVLAFQADHGLATDGVVGSKTWLALEEARRRPLRAVSEDDLRARGSRTITKADEGEKATKAAAMAAVALPAVEVVRDASGVTADAEGLIDTAQRILMNNWPVLLIAVIGAVAWFYGPKVFRDVRRLRTEDARTGANTGR